MGGKGRIGVERHGFGIVDARAFASDIYDALVRQPLGRIPIEAGEFVLYSARDAVGGGPYVVEANYPLVKVRDDAAADRR